MKFIFTVSTGRRFILLFDIPKIDHVLFYFLCFPATDLVYIIETWRFARYIIGYSL